MMLDLKDKSLLETRAYVNGEWLQSHEKFDGVNPSTNQKIASVSDLNVDDVKRAIECAYAAKTDWSAKTGKERSKILRDWHDLMVENADDLATILTAEMGKPYAEARGEILYGASFIEWFAEEA